MAGRCRSLDLVLILRCFNRWEEESARARMVKQTEAARSVLEAKMQDFMQRHGKLLEEVRERRQSEKDMSEDEEGGQGGTEGNGKSSKGTGFQGKEGGEGSTKGMRG